MFLNRFSFLKRSSFLNKYAENKRLFVFWGLLCILANVLCTLGDPYDGDQGYWAGWIQQLADGGFEKFNGNYPPLYVLWLWVVAQIHSCLGLVIGKTFFLKVLCLWPVYFSHLFLVDFCCRLLEKFNYPEWKKHLLVGFVALNPALLLDGPIWGQIDILPVVFVILAIYCISFRRTIVWASLFFMLSILTKFQMIMFLPIFGGLFIKNWRTSWKGLPFAVLGTLIVFLPFIVMGGFTGAFSRAYLQATDYYPYSTFNAMNMWYLVAGNTVRDTVHIFGIDGGSLGFLFEPKWLGKILFVVISIFVFVKSLLCKNLRTAFALCTLNALAFFVVLPSMHERYLMYAIVIALCWLVLDMKKSGPLCLLVTLAAAKNIAFINAFHGAPVWTIVSWVTTLSLLLMLLEIAIPKRMSAFVRLVQRANLPAYVPYAVLGAVLVIQSVVTCCQNRPVIVEKTDKVKFIDELILIDWNQGFGKPHFNKSVDDRVLSVANRTYKNGIGTHAPSNFVYDLPQDADSLFFGVAIDGECQNKGEVVFAVKVDGRNVWRSGIVKGGDKPEFSSVSVNGASRVELLTDPHGSDMCDHADWLNTYVKLQ